MTKQLSASEEKKEIAVRRKYFKKEINKYLKDNGFIKSKFVYPHLYKVFDEYISLSIAFINEMGFIRVNIFVTSGLYKTSDYEYGGSYHPLVIQHDLFDASYYTLPGLEKYKTGKVEGDMLSMDIEDFTKKYIDRFDFMIPKFVEEAKKQFNHPLAKKKKNHILKAAQECIDNLDLIINSDLYEYYDYLLSKFDNTHSPYFPNKIKKLSNEKSFNYDAYRKKYGDIGHVPVMREKFFQKAGISDMDYFRISLFLYGFLSQIDKD